MTKEKYIPPTTITMDNKTLTFQHSSINNLAGERLSEECYYYRALVGGSLVPLVKGQLNILINS